MNDPTPPRSRLPQVPGFFTLLAVLLWVPLPSGAAPLRPGGGGLKGFELGSAGHRHSPAMLLAQAPAAADPAIPAEVQGSFDSAKAAAAKGDAFEALQLQKQVIAWLEANPKAPVLFRAKTLINLGNFLRGVGDRQGALKVTEAAIQLLRPLEGQQAEIRRLLALALNNLGIRFSELGRLQEALAPTEEALTIIRDLAKKIRSFCPIWQMPSTTWVFSWATLAAARKPWLSRKKLSEFAVILRKQTQLISLTWPRH